MYFPDDGLIDRNVTLILYKIHNFAFYYILFVLFITYNVCVCVLKCAYKYIHFYLFNGISIFVVYLMQKSSLQKI